MMRTRSTLVALGALLAVAPAAFAGTSGAVEVEADLVSPATGARIAVVDGSVGANGRGFASIVPLSGAGSAGMVRGEAAQMRRAADGSLLVVGGLGTRLYLAADARTSKSAGWGRLALALKRGRTVKVAANGVAWTTPFTPKKGQRVIVVGTATGAVRNALAARYRLVKYSPSTWSRSALMANPARYRSVAGVLLGQDVTTKQMASLDLPRSFYNSGRWVATSGNPKALDQHMYVVAHAHLGRAGVIMRRATPPPGKTSNRFMQIREPRIVNVRVGSAKALPAKPSTRVMSAATAHARAHLATALAQGEGSGQGANAKAAGSPPVVNASVGTAQMEIAVDQSLSVQVSAPSWLAINASLLNGDGVGATGAIQCSANPTSGAANPNATFNFVPFTNNFVPNQGSGCPGTGTNYDVTSQLMNLDYDNEYLVSLATGNGTGGAVQMVTEATALTADTVADPAGSGMAAGTFQPGGAVTPATYGTLQWFNNGGTCIENQPCPAFFQSIYTVPQEAGLTLAQANHMVTMACNACTGTGGGGATLAYNAKNSSPTEQVQQSAANATTGTNWENSSESTSGWSVGGSLGAFGAMPMGFASGGYNSSTSSSSSNGGSMQVSTSSTLSNWVTQPANVAGTPCSPPTTPCTGPPSSAAYSTWSQNIPGLPQSSTAYQASNALQFNPQALTNTAQVQPLPAQYGSLNPGPQCLQGVQGALQYMCSPGIVGVWGSQMNASGYQQGSITSFTVDVNHTNQLAIGSVTPHAADTFYLWDQWQNQGFCECTGQASVGGLVGAGSISPMDGQFTELQVLDLDQVSAVQVQPQGSPTAASVAVSGGSGTGIAGSLVTNYGANGQVLTAGSASQTAYTTLGLDLCAPPVLTSNLWAAGCNKAAGLSGVPATAAGAGPTITAPGNAIQPNAKGQDLVAPGTPLTCNQGTWSGAPTSYAYQWEQWNAQFSVWTPISGATTNQYTPPTTATGYVLCNVTATNAMGSTPAATPSVQMLTTGG